MSWFSKIDRARRSQDDGRSDRNASVRSVSEELTEYMPPFLSEISAFWFENSGAGTVPDWSHFSPRTHTKFLPHIVLWEVVEGDFFARVVGETAAKLLPVKVANHRLGEVTTDEIASLAVELGQTVSRNVPQYAEQPTAWILEDEIVHRRTIHLPFRADQDETNRVLSVMSFTTEPKLDI